MPKTKTKSIDILTAEAEDALTAAIQALVAARELAHAGACCQGAPSASRTTYRLARRALIDAEGLARKALEMLL